MPDETPGCPHEIFESRVAVRCVDTSDPARTRYEVKLLVRCQACQTPLTYEFAVGTGLGYVPSAVQSRDGTECRLGAWLTTSLLAPDDDAASWQVAQSVNGEQR